MHSLSRRTFLNLGKVPTRFPGAFLASLTATLTAIAAELDIVPSSLAFPVAIASIFAFPTFVAAQLFHEFFGKSRELAYGVALAGAILVGFTVRGAPLFAWPMIAGSISVLGAIALASSISAGGRDSGSGWWSFNTSTLYAIGVGFLFMMVSLIGLIAGIRSIQVLLQITTLPSAQTIFFFCCMFVGPLALLAHLPARAEVETTVFTNVCIALLKWALIPLCSLYAVLLIVYAVTLVRSMEIPNGMVALPVLGLGACGTITLLLLPPSHGQEGWFRAFSRIYPPVFLLFACLLFLAFGIRISEYGWTPERYLGLATGAWFFLSALAFLIVPSQFPRICTALFALLAAGSVFAPFINAADVSIRSQTERLRPFWERFQAGDTSARNSVVDSLHDLARTFGSRGVAALTGPIPSGYTTTFEFVEAVRSQAGVSDDTPVPPSHEFTHKGPLQLPAAGRLWLAENAFSDVRIGNRDDSSAFSIGLRSGKLTAFRYNEILHSFPLLPLLSDAETSPVLPWEYEGRAFFVYVVSARWSGDDFSALSLLVFEK